MSMSYSQSLEQTNTVLHFTDIMCSSGTGFEPSCCSNLLLLILKPTREQEKKKNQTSNIQESHGKEGKNWRWDTTSNFWKDSLDMRTCNSHCLCHGPRVHQDYFQKKTLLLESTKNVDFFFLYFPKKLLTSYCALLQT